jgi:hypothetical protein
LKVQRALFNALDCAVTFNQGLFGLSDTGIRGFDIIAIDCGRLPLVLAIVPENVSMQRLCEDVFDLPDADDVL